MKKPYRHAPRFATSLLALLLHSATILNAETLVLHQEGQSDYANPESWDIFAGGVATPAGRIPVAGDSAVINSGKSAYLSTDVSASVPNLLTVSNQIPGDNTTGEITIAAGGVLKTGRITISTNGSVGRLNIDGGTLLSGQGQILPLLFGSNAGTFNLQGGTYTDLAVGSHSVFTGSGSVPLGHVNISGGSFNAVALAETDALRLYATTVNLSGGTFNITGGQAIPGVGTVFTVQGNGATILTDRLNVNTNAASFNFNFDADGVSPFVSASWINLGLATIRVDGSGYKGGPATFPLFTATNIATLPAPQNISLVGWSGYEVSIVNEEADGKVVGISVAVTGSGQGETWAGFPKRPDGYVDTTPFLGWIWVSDVSDYVWVVNLGGWIYLPESYVTESGAWTFIPR